MAQISELREAMSNAAARFQHLRSSVGIFHLEFVYTVPLFMAFLMHFIVHTENDRADVAAEMKAISVAIFPVTASAFRSSIVIGRPDWRDIDPADYLEIFEAPLTVFLRVAPRLVVIHGTMFVVACYALMLGACALDVDQFCIVDTLENVSNTSLAGLLWLITLAVNIVVLLLLMRRPMEASETRKERPEAAAERLQKLTKRVFTADAETPLAEDTCLVCLSELRGAEGEVRELVCNHVFHDSCIRPWILENRGRCPLRCAAAASSTPQASSDLESQATHTAAAALPETSAIEATHPPSAALPEASSTEAALPNATEAREELESV